MAWYRSGTISLVQGSKDVTGTGTAFVKNVASGFALLGPDLQLYEVDVVASDTMLTLKNEYAGATISVASYAIIQTQGTIAKLASDLADLLNTFGPLRDSWQDVFSASESTLANANAAEAAAAGAANSASAASTSASTASVAAGSASDSAATAEAAATSAESAAVSASASAAAASSSAQQAQTTADGLIGSVVEKTSDTGAAIIPTGTTAQRPAEPSAPMIRRNTDLDRWEGFDGTNWGGIGGGATGAPGNDVFMLNDQVVTGDYAIPAGKNALTAGPITINNGITVTVPNGSTWTVV